MGARVRDCLRRTGVTALAQEISEVFRPLTRRQLVIIFVLRFTLSVAYLSLNSVFMYHLEEALGYSDTDAGMAIFLHGGLMMAMSFLVSPIVDRVGFRKLMPFGIVCEAIGRGFVALSSNRTLISIALYGIIPVGHAFGLPVLSIALKRNTYKKNHDLAMTLFYSIFNFSDILVDVVIYLTTSAMTGAVERFRAVMVVGVLFSIASAPLAALLRGATLDYETGDFAFATETPRAGLFGGTDRRQFDAEGKYDGVRGACRLFFEDLWFLLKMKDLWRLMYLSLAMFCVNSIFQFVNHMFPLYMDRSFGKGTAFSLFQMINPVVVCVFGVVVTCALKKIEIMNRVVFGSALLVSAPAFLVFGTTKALVAGFMFITSLGEIIMNPAFNSYAILLAPVKYEAMFVSLGHIPLVGTKIVAGPASGFLLDRFCPGQWACDGPALWFFVFLGAVFGYALALAGGGSFLRVRNIGGIVK